MPSERGISRLAWNRVRSMTSQYSKMTASPSTNRSCRHEPETFLKVYCLLKNPETRNLITDQNQQTGGTWHFHQIHTDVPTSIIMIGSSRVPPVSDGAGIPHLIQPDGAPSEPLGFTTDHKVDLLPLLPGKHYFFVALVADSFGNWEALLLEFDTLRRQLTVEFPKMHIYNDGDPATYGEGEFWFQVFHRMILTKAAVIEEFHLPEQDIDDWGKTDRPYPVGFAHIGALLPVREGEAEVWVRSWAIEHDGLDADEGARSKDTWLPLPAGQGVENVPSANLLLDCPTSTTDDDFHYGVDVTWSVAYMP